MLSLFHKMLSRDALTVACLTGLLSIPIMVQMVFGARIGDVETHIHFIQKAQSTGTWPLYSLFYLFVDFVSFGASSYNVLGYLTISVLGASVGLKGLVTYLFFKDQGVAAAHSVVLTLTLMVVMPVANWWDFPYVYIGQIAPTVWHNSTTIFAMPFAIFAFFSAIRWLMAPSGKNALSTVMFISIATLAKPNYSLALVPTLCLLAFIAFLQGRFDERRWYIAGMIMFATAFIAVCAMQYVSLASLGSSNSRIVIAPFRAWAMYSPNILASFLLSAAFPLVFMCCYIRERKPSISLVGAWLVFIVAVIQMILFAETGDRSRDFNFAWGPHMASYILFVATAAELMKHRTSAKAIVCYLTLGLHAITGAFFYLWVASGRSYIFLEGLKAST